MSGNALAAGILADQSRCLAYSIAVFLLCGVKLLVVLTGRYRVAAHSQADIRHIKAFDEMPASRAALVNRIAIFQ